MTLSEYSHCKEDLLIDSIVSNEVVCLFVGDRHVIYLGKGHLFVLPQSITMLDFEVLVIEVMDKILANVAKGYDILHFFFEFCNQDLILFNFHQLRLIQIKLLLKVNMLHLVPMILLQKTTLVQHHLEIYQLQLDLEIYLSTL